MKGRFELLSSLLPTIEVEVVTGAVIWLPSTSTTVVVVAFLDVVVAPETVVVVG